MNESSLTKVCATLCRKFSTERGIKMDNGQELCSRFEKLLNSRCHIEGNSFRSTMPSIKKHIKEIKDYKGMDHNDDNKSKLLKRRSGIIRFIIELFNLNMVSVGVMHRFIDALIKSPEEESLEYLYTLLTAVGKGLELTHPKQLLQIYYENITEIVQNAEKYKASIRVRLLLQDLLITLQSNWVSAIM